MSGFGVVSFYHPGDAGFDAWLAGEHLAAMKALPGFVRVLPFRIADHQILGDQAQPWQGALIHEFAEGPTPEQIAAIAHSFEQSPALNGGSGRSAHVFEWLADWRRQPGTSSDVSHLTLVMANANPGQDEAYNAWYEDYHIADTLTVPGNVAMRRGKLSDRQIAPDNQHPAGYVVMVAMQTGDVVATTGETGLRSIGKSASGYVFNPRSPAVSDNRTIHVLEATGPALA